jgi:hypothetical protein
MCDNYAFTYYHPFDCIACRSIEYSHFPHTRSFAAILLDLVGARSHLELLPYSKAEHLRFFKATVTYMLISTAPRNKLF